MVHHGNRTGGETVKRRQDKVSGHKEVIRERRYSPSKRLFHYFATKEKLYEELVCIAMEASQGWLEDSAVRPLEFFMEMTEQILQMLLESPEKAKYFILLAQAQRSATTPHSVLQLLAAQEGRYAKTVALIRAGQQRGELRSGAPDALAYAYWCSIQGIAEQLVAHPETPFPDAAWIVAILKK